MKNRIKSTFLSLFLSFFVLPAVLACFPRQALAFAGGTGTSGDPYQITTAADLASVSSYLGAGNSGKYFKVMNNIDLNVSPYNTGTGWTPIGTSSNYFYGKFDGNFKTISNLYYNNSSGNYAGLFGVVGSSGIISNTILSTATVSGNLEVGSLAGANYGSITKSAITGGSVTGIQRIGGLVGSNYGAMTYDYSNNSVYFNPTSSATCCAGGLIAEAYSSGTINNSYSRSSVTMTYNIYNQGAVGGLYGNDYSSGAKSNLYSTGVITMVSGSFPSSTGGLAGSNYTSTSSSYWDTQTSGWATSSGGAGVVGKTTAEMKTQSTYSGWDFSTIWAIDSNGVINNGYPYLQWSVTDSTAPTITNVSSDKANGNYTTGEVIDIDVTFSETVTSTGNVTVTLETGTTDRTCTFTVTGASTGTCNYTVQAGDTTSDLTVLSISGTIADASANSMSNFVPTTNLAANKALVIDTAAPSTPGTPSTTTPSGTATPAWSWTASTDSGSGLATTAYTVQWSQSSSFSSGVSASTSTTNSFTQPTSLADGTWYFRVLATDMAGNNSSYSTAGSVLVDSTAPSVPGTPSSSSSKTNNTPTWTWAVSTDSGSGLATTAYTVQWSKDSSFGGGVSSTTSTSASFTQPTSLSDSTWYFRVKAADTLGNSSAYSLAGSMVIDTYVPPAPVEDIPEVEDIPISDLDTTTEESTTDPQIVDSPITVILNDFQSYTSGEGKQLALGPNQVVKFKVEAETHSATIQEVGTDYAILLLQSEPITVYLGVGQTSRYDVNRDGQNDISITLNGVTNGVANLVFAQLSQSKPVVVQSSKTTSWHKFALSILIVVIVVLIARTLWRAGHKSKSVGF